MQRIAIAIPRVGGAPERPQNTQSYVRATIAVTGDGQRYELGITMESQTRRTVESDSQVVPDVFDFTE